MTESLDATDWSILAELQRDGRIPLTELGRRVNLSASATTERVKRLETTGVITGYRAGVDLVKAGFAVLAVVRLKYPGSRHQPRLQPDAALPRTPGASAGVPVRIAPRGRGSE
ncbi:DNA-binding Lrp family transcriptional regulator [Streptosporangium album]|uniref:DNA-binding Lrp family transcriptional regulator n=1 Tax=Streptosporangium album TaxID=47479 RepID=A0A7W7S4A4_9ACTN|nr:Lrp/AsnC family transcriptional regulator [Streptosporangium album]MBB4943638.1 DNA-binding Lrp family transcriptional regulator [Streptosporangium album]